MTDTNPTPLLTPRELADRWSVSEKGLANDRSAGRGIPFVKLGAKVRYRLTDIEAHESENVVTPGDAK